MKNIGIIVGSTREGSFSGRVAQALVGLIPTDYEATFIQIDQLPLYNQDYDDLLGNPEYDPHGGVIPNADGTVNLDKYPLVKLKDLNINEYFLVREVPDEDSELLNYLSSKGFSLNDQYHIEDVDAYDGTITIHNVNTSDTFTISGQALEKIRVTKVNRP